FAHVAGKLMTRERFVCGWFETGELFPVTLGVLPEKVRGERRDVFAPLAQRRQGDLDRVQAKKKILPEASCGDFLVQIGIGCGNDADIGMQGSGGTDALEFAGLND